jgi:hypothetical protein
MEVIELLNLKESFLSLRARRVPARESISFCKSTASTKMPYVKIIKKKLLRAPQITTMC